MSIEGGPLTYSVAQAAQRIPCKERWLADSLRAGRFTACKIGNQWRLTDGDIDAIIRACRTTGQARPKPATVNRFADALAPRSRRSSA